jgi:hypothetical protein
LSIKKEIPSENSNVCEMGNLDMPLWRSISMTLDSRRSSFHASSTPARKEQGLTQAMQNKSVSHLEALWSLLSCDYEACKKFPITTISSCEKDLDNLLMSVCVIFALMVNDSFKSFNPIEEDGLQVFQGQLVSYAMNFARWKNRSRDSSWSSSFSKALVLRQFTEN